MAVTKEIRIFTLMAVLPAVLAQDARLPGYLEGLMRIREQWR